MAVLLCCTDMHEKFTTVFAVLAVKKMNRSGAFW
jgi:hypothetical protein